MLTEVSTNSEGIMNKATMVAHIDKTVISTDTTNENLQKTLPNPPRAVFVYKPTRGLSYISNCFIFYLKQ